MVFVLGVVQFLAGCYIMAMSGGAAFSIGISLMVEGIKDMYKSVNSWITGVPIDFKEWAKDKAISLTLTFMFSGTEALKELSTMGSSLLKTVGETSMKEILK
jgi:hypothetical protein